MATELINLELDELSLVPKGANQLAKAPIFKSHITDGETMSEITKMTDGQKEELDKMSADMKTKMNGYMKEGMSYDKAKAMCNEEARKSLEEDITKLKAEVEFLRKGFLDEGYAIEAGKITKGVTEEYIDFDGEPIAKSTIPAPVLKKLEEAEVAKADAELTTKAEATLPHFDLPVAKSLLQAVAKMSDAEALVAALVAADTAFADKMEELGKTHNDGDFTAPKDKVDALVKSYKEANPSLTYAQAYAAVAKTAEGAALITKSYKDKE